MAGVGTMLQSHEFSVAHFGNLSLCQGLLWIEPTDLS